MKITLVTACYNSVATIRDAIESVKRQILPPGVELEHLVIDGGSTDGTTQLLAPSPSPSPSPFSFRWISEPDRGMYDAINKGIRMATGEVIGILNADDWLDGDDVIARVAEAWTREEGLDCLYGNVRFVNAAKATTRICFARLWRPWMLQWGYMPPHPAIFIRKACFEKWGAYVPERTEYRIAADYELLIRYFRVQKMRARYMPLCTTVMRPGGLSTKDVEARRKLNAEIIKGNRANGYFCIWPMLLPKYAVKIWEFILPRVYPFLKRSFDIFASGCAILVLSPLLVPVMIGLKLTGEHDIFYGQTRIGFHNAKFKIWKFATMLRNSPNMAGGLHTMERDPRILPMGNFLRKTKINELPQLFNIFLGDMSVIGPRPLVDKTFAPYSDAVKARIYDSRPGLSGIGSIVFRDEERLLAAEKTKGGDMDVFYAEVVAPYKGAVEMWYQRHAGVWTDLLLIFLTAWVVLKPKSTLVEKVFKDLPAKPENLRAALAAL